MFAFSSYSTLMAREQPALLKDEHDETGELGPPAPAINATAGEWCKHLNDKISFMMTVMLQRYGTPGIKWNAHLIQQIDHIRGRTNLDFIGCVFGTKDLKFVTDCQLQHIYELTHISRFNPNGPKSDSPKNVHENHGKIPLDFDDWLNVKYLTEHTKELIREFYRVDFELFEFVCGTADHPDPMFWMNSNLNSTRKTMKRNHEHNERNGRSQQMNEQRHDVVGRF